TRLLRATRLDHFNAWKRGGVSPAGGVLRLRRTREAEQQRHRTGDENGISCEARHCPILKSATNSSPLTIGSACRRYQTERIGFPVQCAGASGASFGDIKRSIQEMGGARG